MTLLTLLFSVAVVSLVATWGRSGLRRSERRAMRSYEHSLQVLGEVTRRSDRAARQADSEPAEEEPVTPATSAASSPDDAHEEEVLRFDDESDAFERAQEGEDESATTRRVSGAGRPAALGTPSSSRRLARPVLVAAAVLVAGLAVAGYLLSRPQPAVHTAARQGAHRHHDHVRPPGGSSTSTSSTTTPSVLLPVSSSSSVVAFVAPKGSYSIAMIDSGGPCWVGIAQSPGGPYIWQEMLESGESASYTATGPVVVRIGAPKFLGVKVNGVTARLPGYVQPYDLDFNPSSEPSSA